MIKKYFLPTLILSHFFIFFNANATVGAAFVRDNDANNKLSNIESKIGTANQDRKLQLNEIRELKDSFNNNYVEFNSLSNNYPFRTKIPENNLPNLIKDREKNVIENKIRNTFKNQDLKVTKRDVEKERKQKIREEQNLQALIYTSQIINNDKYAQRELDQLITEAGNLKTPKESLDFNNKLLLLLIAEMRQEKMLKAIEIRNNIAEKYDGITNYINKPQQNKTQSQNPFSRPTNNDFNFKFN